MRKTILLGAIFLALIAAAFAALGTVVQPVTQDTYARLGQTFTVNFNVTANATQNLTSCNASLVLPTGISVVGNSSILLPVIANDTYNLTTWTLNSTLRGSFFVQYLAVCNESLTANKTNRTIHVDVLNITAVSLSPSIIAKNASVNITATVYHLGGSYGVNATEVNVTFEGTDSTLVNCTNALVSGTNCTARLTKMYGSEGAQAYTINVTSVEGSYWTTNTSFTVIDDLALRIDNLDASPIQPREFALNVTATVNRTLTSCIANVTGAPGFIGSSNITLGTISSAQSLNWRLNTSSTGQFNVSVSLNCSDVYENLSRTISVAAQGPRLALLSSTLPSVSVWNRSFAFTTIVLNNGTSQSWVNITVQQGSLNFTNLTQVCRNETDQLAENGNCSLSWTVVPRAVGTVYFNITLEGNGTTTNLSQSIRVYNQSTLAVWPANLSFGMMAHNTTNATLYFYINETAGGDSLYNISWSNSTAANIPFIYATAESLENSTARRLNVTLSVARFTSPGVYNGSILISPFNGNNVTLNYTVNVSKTVACEFTASSYSVSTIARSGSATFASYVANLGNVPINITVSGNTPSGGASAVTAGTSTNLAINTTSGDVGGSVTARSDATVGSNTLLSTLTAYCTNNAEQGTSQASLYATSLTSGSSGSSGSSSSLSVTQYQFAFWAETESFTVRQGESIKIPFKVVNSGTVQIKDMKVAVENILPSGIKPYQTLISTIDASNTAANTLKIDIEVGAKVGRYNVTLEACHTHDGIKECHSTPQIRIEVIEPSPEKLAEVAAAEAAAKAANLTTPAPEVPAPQLNMSTAEDTLTVDLPKVGLKENVTAEIIITDLGGNVLYNVTHFFASLENVSQVQLDLASKLPKGQYKVFVSMKDLAGTVLTTTNTSLAVTTPATKAAAAQGAPNLLLNFFIGLIITACIAFFGVWAYTGDMPFEALLREERSFVDDVRRKAAEAFAKGQYGKADILKRKAAELPKAEAKLKSEISKLEAEHTELYTHGNHKKAREVRDRIIELRGKLDELRKI